ncbi:uncharacterized protein MKK02DRAFT_30233 [Dioszegia hungarica]|uniref:Uncharacterized protein n=1 Tax=Dioszegia hungarica TaxID=4972 RepID=A0AA38LQX1_9TREE|nr:uncharacterized protein MKK02DRAFT_30233 [Dioszegia hungarica]KAI9632415.1 hypothetical protein MKK02DRAFT_30233 [Dioszegia hungarica]
MSPSSLSRQFPNQLFVYNVREFFSPTRASGIITSAMERSFRASSLGRPLHDYSTHRFLTRLVVTDMQNSATGDGLSHKDRESARADAAEGIRSILRSIKSSIKKAGRGSEDTSGSQDVQDGTNQIVYLTGTQVLVHSTKHREFSDTRHADLGFKYGDDLRPLLAALAPAITKFRGADSDPVQYYQSDPGAHLRTTRGSAAPHRVPLDSPGTPVNYITKDLEILTSKMLPGIKTWYLNELEDAAKQFPRGNGGLESLAIYIPYPLGVDETEMPAFCAEAKAAMDAILRKNKANTKTESGEEAKSASP